MLRHHLPAGIRRSRSRLKFHIAGTLARWRNITFFSRSAGAHSLTKHSPILSPMSRGGIAEPLLNFFKLSPPTAFEIQVIASGGAWFNILKIVFTLIYSLQIPRWYHSVLFAEVEAGLLIGGIVAKRLAGFLGITAARAFPTSLSRHNDFFRFHKSSGLGESDTLLCVARLTAILVAGALPPQAGGFTPFFNATSIF